MDSPTPKRLAGAMLAVALFPVLALAYGSIALAHARGADPAHAAQRALSVGEFHLFMHGATLLGLLTCAVLGFTLDQRTAKSGKSSA